MLVIPFDHRAFGSARKDDVGALFTEFKKSFVDITFACIAHSFAVIAEEQIGSGNNFCKIFFKNRRTIA